MIKCTDAKSEPSFSFVGESPVADISARWVLTVDNQANPAPDSKLSIIKDRFHSLFLLFMASLFFTVAIYSSSMLGK